MKEAYPDPDREDVCIAVVEIKASEPLSIPVTLADIKKSGLFPD